MSMNAFAHLSSQIIPFDFFQVMDTFQKNLLNNNFELIATELFNDDPKLQIENLKVRFQTQRFISAKRKKFSRLSETFFNTTIFEGVRHRWTTSLAIGVSTSTSSKRVG